jgi:hypothetical protein
MEYVFLLVIMIGGGALFEFLRSKGAGHLENNATYSVNKIPFSSLRTKVLFSFENLEDFNGQPFTKNMCIKAPGEKKYYKGYVNYRSRLNSDSNTNGSVSIDSLDELKSNINDTFVYVYCRNGRKLKTIGANRQSNNQIHYFMHNDNNYKQFIKH